MADDNIKPIPVTLSPKESAIMTYNYVCADLREGIVYGVAKELYNTSMEAIGSPKRVGKNEGITNRMFANDFYEEWKRLNPTNGSSAPSSSAPR